jgi:SAM-dependent methyltransferase
MPLLFAATIFLSSFLLFLVQPMIAKQILPWFGGAASVWTTCLLFFQALLLAGYAYAHASLRLSRPRTRAILHVVLLVGSAAVLPIIVGASWKPTGAEEPVARILLLLAATIGLPYFMLSTTGPLVQVWYATTLKRIPYRLFSLSNIASLLALLLYPVAIEPWVATRSQALGWSAAFAAFVVLCAVAAVLGGRAPPPRAGDAPHVDADADDAGRTPRGRDYVRWIMLAGLASFMLLAVSNHVTQNIASIPFLWIPPLALYLLSFILCFDHDGWYRPRIYLALLIVALPGMGWLLDSLDLKVAIPTYLAGLFLVCMFCHGEIARQRPAAGHLTGFYLMISLGGVLGGLLVAVVAPLLLSGYFELGFGLAACAMLVLVRRSAADRWAKFAFVPVLLFAFFCIYRQWEDYGKDALVTVRDFYGALRVFSEPREGNELVTLRHGRILHGAQWLAPTEQRRLPVTYYGPASGLGVVLSALHPESARRLGMVGLGAGTLAAYGKPGDVVRFYEINPQVVDIARTRFHYMGESAAKVEVALGDARLSLDREPPQRFDLLAIDAFSGDAIPTHLLSAEAMDLYLRHVRPDGAILFHVTNRYLDLAPVVARIAASRGLRAGLIEHEPDDEEESLYHSTSDWVVVTRNAGLLSDPEVAKVVKPIEITDATPLWTDDFNNLVRVLK